MSTQHRWEIIVYSGSYYPALSHTFISPDINLAYESDMGSQFSAYSCHIDELDEPMAVSKRLYSLELLLNGALYIASSKLYESPIKFDHFYKIEGGSFNPTWTDSIEEYPFSINLQTNMSCLDYRRLQSCFPSYLVYLSRYSDELRTILFLCGMISRRTPLENILTWSTLYKIMDTVKYYSKQINIEIKNIVDITELEKFKATCNNMSILGLNARHGVSGNKPPTNVMTDINEAITLILKMTNLFVQEFITAKCLRYSYKGQVFCRKLLKLE